MTTISTPASVTHASVAHSQSQAQVQGGPSVVNTQGFRYFRVYKTGNPGTGTSNLLHIAAIELYGVLIEAPAPTTIQR